MPGRAGARSSACCTRPAQDVIATSRRADRLEELAQDCGNRIQTIAGDIADPHHRQAVIDMVRPHGRLDVLVSNADICDDGPLEQQSLDDLRRVVEVNLISVLDLCRLTADLLRAAPAGSVINVASMYGIVRLPRPDGRPERHQSRFGQPHPAPRRGLGPGRRRVNALAPGHFPTDLTGFLADPAFAQSIRDRTLLGPQPDARRIDGPLLFLATDASS